MIFRLAFATIVSTWVGWQIPFSSTAEIKLPEIAAFTAFSEAAAVADKPVAAVFYQRTGAGQYRVFGLSVDGAIVRMLNLPGEKIVKADQTSISLAGKEGYITAPENGAYYIWYPQIGSQVYVFNEHGNFLWDKDESHYLQVLPRGRYLLAAAGDHSRMIFMNPDFKMQADFQGVLFTRYVVDDNPDLKNAQVCLGSLDGEVIVAHIDQKVYLRQKLGYALKSLLCNFETSELTAIIERTVVVDKIPKQVDFLLRAKFSLKPPKNDKPAETMQQLATELDLTHTIELPVRTAMASPMVIAGDSVCFLQLAPPAHGGMGSATGTMPSLSTTEAHGGMGSATGAHSPDSLALYYTRGKKNALEYAVVGSAGAPTGAAQATDLAPDLWKSAAISLASGGSACLFVHRSGQLIVANDRGILMHRKEIALERLVMTGDTAYLQTKNGILALR